MKNCITFEESELTSTLTTLGYKLHQIAESIIYFKQYAKIKGVEHDYVSDSAITIINEVLNKLKYDFNAPMKNNSCLENFEGKNIEDVVERCNRDHDNPYLTNTIHEMKDIIRSFISIAEREGKTTNWEGIKLKCKKIL